MKTEMLLHDEIQNEFEGLKEMDLGSEKYTATVDGLTKLVDRAIEIDKLNSDNSVREEDKKDRFIKNCIAVGGIAIPTLVTIWGTLKSFEFEKEGTITTIMGRGFINKLLPKK